MCWAGRARLTSRCIERVRETRAQASVEAAALLPVFLTLLLLAIQPVCLLYTQAVMEQAAASTARLMVTAQDDDEAYRAFALRRLASVPDLEIFHAGGPLAWEIELGRAADTGGWVSIAIEGAVRPLPVLGAFAGAFGKTNAHGDVELRVEVAYEGRPMWLEGGYGDWTAIWD